MNIPEGDETSSSNVAPLVEGPPLSANAPSYSDAESPHDPLAAPISRLLPLSTPPHTRSETVNAFEMGTMHGALPPGPHKVWWGKVDVEPPPNDTSSQHLQRPSLETERNKQQGPRSPSKSRRFYLEDVLQSGPYEEEGQTHILKALEHTYPEHYNPQRSDDNATTSTLLSQVPNPLRTISTPMMERARI
jgi:hypothetical protein